MRAKYAPHLNAIFLQFMMDPRKIPLAFPLDIWLEYQIA